MLWSFWKKANGSGKAAAIEAGKGQPAPPPYAAAIAPVVFTEMMAGQRERSRTRLIVWVGIIAMLATAYCGAVRQVAIDKAQDDRFDNLVLLEAGRIRSEGERGRWSQ